MNSPLDGTKDLAQHLDFVGVDFEFISEGGNPPIPVCVVAKNFKSGVVTRIWKEDLQRMKTPPYLTDDNTVIVAYLASAELGCHHALGWPMPKRILDLYPEFRNLTNGAPPPQGNGLLGAMGYFGLPGITVSEKKTMRNLILGGGPWTPDEIEQILDYCQSDVDALFLLFEKMLPHLNLQQALLRGQYMISVATMENRGIPLDVHTVSRLKAHREPIVAKLIEQVDSVYGVFENGVFKTDRFASYLFRHNIPWPVLESGHLDLRDETFASMVTLYPELEDLRVLRKTLVGLRKNALVVGHDGRTRCMLSPFASRTSRNQPSNSSYIFGLPSWYRSLIIPTPGSALLYVDYAQQEFGIAAYLSGDKGMQQAYESADPYLTFAKMAGAVPETATKESHKREREMFKTCSLGVLYGLSEYGLAQRTGLNELEARQLLEKHKTAFPEFWKWSDAAQDIAALRGELVTVFGWHCRWPDGFNARSARNFPAQSNGAEMLRIACMIATQGGLGLCAPVHDALLFETETDSLETTTLKAEAAMVRASRIILGGPALKVDTKVIRHPDRFVPEKGLAMWGRVCSILKDIDGEDVA